MYTLTAYDRALAEILNHGKDKTDRTGVGTLSIAGMQCRYRLDDAFPILTRRRVWPGAIFAELLWVLSGSTNTLELNQLGSRVWDSWRSEDFEKDQGYSYGDLGPIYGHQLRRFGADYKDKLSTGFDQLMYMMQELKNNPDSRRIMFSLWNPNNLHRQRLPPCHYSFQLLANNGELTGILTQRSADFPIGVPANIQFYAALTLMFAQQAGMRAVELVHNTGDSHIYLDQTAAVEQYLATPIVQSPGLHIETAAAIDQYTMNSFVLTGYNPGPAIKIPVAV